MSSRDATMILAAQLILCPVASAQDHLEPERGILSESELQWDYGQELRRVLLKNTADYHVARMVCLPAFQPEWMVTIVRDDPEDLDAPHSYHVEYAGAERKLFRADDARDITVRRVRAPLDRETAESLNKVWHRMLRDTHYPKEPRLGADGVVYHFSRFLPIFDRGRADPYAGREQGTIWTPDEESLCGELVALGERLRTYAMAQPEDRQRMCREIRERTTRLTVRLEAKGKGRGPGKGSGALNKGS